MFVVHLRVQRHAHSLSLSEVPLLVGMALMAPAGLLLAQTLGVGMVLGFHRRQRAFRLAFNLAQRCCTTVFAILAFHGVLSLGDSSWGVVWIAGMVAVLLADVLAGVLINAGIVLAEGDSLRRSDRASTLFDGVVGVGTGFALANAALGLLTIMMLAEHPSGVLLVLSPAATTFIAGRAYSKVQRQHDDLTRLFEGTGLAQSSLDLETMLSRILAHAREMFRADVAEVVLFPEAPDEEAVGMSQDRDQPSAGLRAMQVDPWEGVTAQAVARREGVLLARPIANPRLAAHFTRRNIRDAVVVPLLGEDEVLGTLLVGNRQGEFSTFDQDDLRLLGTFANHLVVAVQNVRLVGRLESSLTHETEMSKQKDDFVATISHELRTPLTSIQGYLKTLLRSDTSVSPDEQLEFLARADRQAERLRRLIEELLFAASLDAEGGTKESVVDVVELVSRVVEEAGWNLAPSRLVLRLPTDLPRLRTDREHVYRIVRNLIENALKYSPEDRQVVVSAAEADGGISLSVQDDGPGIDDSEHEKIFERFYQVDQSSTRSIGGTGMGLHICRQAALAIGGRVWLERSDAEGSVFSFWLPLLRAEKHDGGALTRGDSIRPQTKEVVRI
jgi:signal transduction histidine kinase